MASELHKLQPMETEASRCSFCDALFRSRWPLPFELSYQDSGVVTYICPQCTNKEEMEADYAQSLLTSYPQVAQIFDAAADDSRSPANPCELSHDSHHFHRVVHKDFLDDVLTMLDTLRWHRLQRGQSDRPLHVLHIGCGDGTLLHRLRSHASMPLVLVGIESCALCAAKAEHYGLTISSTPLENEVRPAKIAFDLIIEHGSSENLAAAQLHHFGHRKVIGHHLMNDGIFIAERSDGSFAQTEIYWDSLYHHAGNPVVQQHLATLSSHCTFFPMHELNDAVYSLKRHPLAGHREAPALLPKRRTKSSWRVRLTTWASALQARLGE